MRVQEELFAGAIWLPPGMRLQNEFISAVEEAELIAAIREQPLKEAQYRQFTARRRIVSFGGRYDFSSQELLPAGPIPPFLHPIRERVARWTQIPAERFTHALIAEYQPGTQLGWHRDVPDFEAIAGISLLGRARMRLRPYPPRKSSGVRSTPLDLEPRSAYSMTGEARWRWQHAISPTKELRYSLTFRTLAQ